MAKKKIRKAPIIIAIVILISAALCIFICRCISLAFTDNIEDKYTITDGGDNTFLKTILVGAAFGKEFEVSESEFNTYINEKYCTEPEEGKSGPDHIRFYFHDFMTHMSESLQYRIIFYPIYFQEYQRTGSI